MDCKFFYVLLIDGDVVAVGDTNEVIIAFNQLIDNLPPTDGIYKFELVKHCYTVWVGNS